MKTEFSNNNNVQVESIDSRKWRIVRIPFVNQKDKTIRFDRARVYPLPFKFVDGSGVSYQVYLQEKLEFYKGIRCNNPGVGIVSSGIFMRCCFYEALQNRSDEILAKFAEMNVKDSVQAMVTPYREVES